MLALLLVSFLISLATGSLSLDVAVVCIDVAELLYSFAEADGKQALAVHWEPPPEYDYKWKHKPPVKPKSLRIYECHVGISGQEPKVSSFDDFISKVTTLYFILQFFNHHSSNLVE